MTYPQLLMACLCSLFLLPATAQKNFVPAKIKPTATDTLAGYIDYRNWERNPDKIFFKNTPESTVTTYSVENLDYFEITGKEAYRKAVVLKDMLPVQIDRLEPEGSEHTVRDTAFLRILVSGKHYTLYQLVDEKEHFYIQEGADTLQELQYKVLLRPDRINFTVRNTFQNQLKVLAFRSAKMNLVSRIERARYREKDLKKIVADLNGGVEHATTVQAESGQKKMQVFAGAGLQRNNIQFSGGNPQLNALQASPTINYLAVAGLDIYSKRQLQRLLLRAELQYSRARYYGHSEAGGRPQNEYDLQMNIISPSVYALYTFLKGEKIRLFAGVGGGTNITTYTKNDFTTYPVFGEPRRQSPYLDFAKNWVDLKTKGGLIIGNHLEVNVTHRVAGTFAQFAGISVTNPMTAVALAYRL